MLSPVHIYQSPIYVVLSLFVREISVFYVYVFTCIHLHFSFVLCHYSFSVKILFLILQLTDIRLVGIKDRNCVHMHVV